MLHLTNLFSVAPQFHLRRSRRNITPARSPCHNLRPADLMCTMKLIDGQDSARSSEEIAPLRSSYFPALECLRTVLEGRGRYQSRPLNRTGPHLFPSSRPGPDGTPVSRHGPGLGVDRHPTFHVGRLQALFPRHLVVPEAGQPVVARTQSRSSGREGMIRV